jgi:hypothetical protein
VWEAARMLVAYAQSCTRRWFEFGVDWSDAAGDWNAFKRDASVSWSVLVAHARFGRGNQAAYHLAAADAPVGAARSFEF